MTYASSVTKNANALSSVFKRVLRSTVYLVSVVMLSGCGTIYDGTSQTFTVSSYPSGAQCEIKRRGGVILTIESTPASVDLSTSRYGIGIVCQKTEYETLLSGSATLQSTRIGEEWSTFKYISLGLFWLIDTMTGANRRYPSEVRVELE